MRLNFAFPSVKESIVSIIILIVYSALTAIFIGFRQEHWWLIVFFSLFFFANAQSRKLVVGLVPFFIFGISYDWMRVFPNYKVNPIDIEELFNLEKLFFGIEINGIKQVLSEYFASHNYKIIDFFAGIFYLGWVPVPLALASYLYLKNKKDNFLRFSIVFLFVNIIGFIGYYIHPAAPPWYVMNYGFEPVLDTPGNMAGLSRFDNLIGFPVFGSIYGRNSNVFAALPSLHSAYLVIALFYAVKAQCPFPLSATVGLFMCGIWFTAIYTAHHYIIDVLLGIFCAVAGIVLFEYILMKQFFCKLAYQKYLNYIT
jgi:hypothetical protein